MSLLEEAFEDYTLLKKVRTSDGYGGFKVSYTDDMTISVAMIFDQSTESMIAQANGVTNVYKLVTKRNTVLEYHDVVRRVSTGKILRVTSDGDDYSTPKSADLDMRIVTAEEWEIPADE